MMQRRRVDELWRSRDFRALIFLGALGALTVILAFAIRGILGPFILAGILALMLNPAVNAAERRRVPRLAAVLALYGIIAALVAGGVFSLLPRPHRQPGVHPPRRAGPSHRQLLSGPRRQGPRCFHPRHPDRSAAGLQRCGPQSTRVTGGAPLPGRGKQLYCAHAV